MDRAIFAQRPVGPVSMLKNPFGSEMGRQLSLRLTIVHRANETMARAKTKAACMDSGRHRIRATLLQIKRPSTQKRARLFGRCENSRRTTLVAVMQTTDFGERDDLARGGQV